MCIPAVIFALCGLAFVVVTLIVATSQPKEPPFDQEPGQFLCDVLASRRGQGGSRRRRTDGLERQAGRGRQCRRVPRLR